jgi:8-oxo-dGTP pyrophosphatase MutT (NUDIX family)
MRIDYNTLETRLQKPLPGSSAHIEMAPERKETEQDYRSFKKAAVLLLLLDDNTSTTFVLIKRTVDDGPHSGQISLPGGKMEETDYSPLHTALRETTEEIGIEGRLVHNIGALTPLSIPVSRFIVHPFVGYCHNTMTFVADPAEVEYIIIPSVEELMQVHSLCSTQLKVRNHIVSAPFFHLKDEMVWGATAMILNEFRHILHRIND